MSTGDRISLLCDDCGKVQREIEARREKDA